MTFCRYSASAEYDF